MFWDFPLSSFYELFIQALSTDSIRVLYLGSFFRLFIQAVNLGCYLGSLLRLFIWASYSLSYNVTSSSCMYISGLSSSLFSSPEHNMLQESYNCEHCPSVHPSNHTFLNDISSFTIWPFASKLYRNDLCVNAFHFC